MPSNIPDLIKKNELESTAPDTHGQSCSGNREVREAAALNRYDVKDVVLNCPKEYLGGALSSIVTRIYDMEEELNA